MWFKKKSQISGYNANTAYDGTDWCANGSDYYRSVSQTLPSAADANNYFYLPPLGRYIGGLLYDIGVEGDYWSSTSPGNGGGGAYSLFIGSGYVIIDYRYNRAVGMRVGTFE